MGMSMGTPASDGGKKPVDADLNLVPFIDLLVCCICFLLITAVWTQMAAVKSAQQAPGTQGQTAPKMVPKRVTVLVGTDGRVKDIQLIESPHEDFWSATRKQALRKWRFTPATKDGKPVESWMTLKVLFQINS